MMLVVVFGLREILQMSNNREQYPTIKGTLDRDTALYLRQQDIFISDFANILEADFPMQNSNQESTDGKWLESLTLMQNTIRFMRDIDVSEQFLDYKKEVDLCYSDVVSILENMAATDSFDANRLSNMYSGLLYFSDQKVDDLPALFDELGVEYTVEIGENGQKTISYRYTDVNL